MTMNTAFLKCGAMAAYLAKLRSSGTYKSMKNFVTSTLRKAGLRTLKKLLKSEVALKEAFQLDTFFEKLELCI